MQLCRRTRLLCTRTVLLRRTIPHSIEIDGHAHRIVKARLARIVTVECH